MSGAYYNEIDPNAAEWLRQLIRMGAIAPGDVDERSIVDVPSDELKPYTQHHFFAGVGVWSYALRQAGWEDDRPIATGSCPCQPYSTAGKRKGADDERDLWWAMFWHCCQLRPQTIIGEQVASKDGLAWWDVVQSDLENAHYAATAFDLCAAGVGAPHIRQRLYWVAHSDRRRFMGNANSDRWGKVGHDYGTDDGNLTQSTKQDLSGDRGLDYTVSQGSQGRKPGILRSPQRSIEGDLAERASYASFWSDTEWLPCSDGKSRAAKPGAFPLVNGIAPDLVRGSDLGIQTEATAEARAMRLKGYGNAIVAPLAVEFIKAVMEVIS